MAQELCAINTLVPFEYLKRYHRYSDSDLEAIVDEVSIGIPSKVTNLKTGKKEDISLEHLKDESYWISNRFVISLYDKLEELIPDPDLGYKIGLKSTELHEVKRYH